MSVPAWRLMASTSAGWQWPMQVTPQPDIRSMNSRPWASRSREPRPSTSATGWRFTTGRKCSASRARMDSMSMIDLLRANGTRLDGGV